MNNTTSIINNNSPYTIQTTTNNGTSISFQINQSILNSNKSEKKNSSKKVKKVK